MKNISFKTAIIMEVISIILCVLGLFLPIPLIGPLLLVIGIIGVILMTITIVKLGKKSENIKAVSDTTTPSPKPSTVSKSTQSPDTVADELLKYKNLLDMGAITQEEFDTKKSELLNGSTPTQEKNGPASTSYNPKKPLSKEENKKAYETWFSSREQSKHLTSDELMAKFTELFSPDNMTAAEKEKVKATAIFKVGADRACFNSEKTAVLMCEMPNNLTLGATRNMSVLDLSDGTCYYLKYGKGYKQMCEFFERM